MRLLVCGGRTFYDVNLLNQVLDEMHTAEPITLIIQGLARGADMLAARWADKNNIPIESYRAEWNKYGKPAGAIRNWVMLKEGKPDMVVAFPGGKGTADMINQTRIAKIPLKIIKRRGV
jgi:hypothetical protein